MSNDCPWCDEPVLDGDAYPADAYGYAGTIHHRECWVRLVCGSVGHQLKLCGHFALPAVLGDPPGWTRREAAAVAAKLAQDLAVVPGYRLDAAIADARLKVLLLGPDTLFAWTPGVVAN